MNQAREQVMNDHVDHFKNNVYMAIKMLSPFLEESDMTAFVSSIILKLYE